MTVDGNASLVTHTHMCVLKKTFSTEYCLKYIILIYRELLEQIADFEKSELSNTNMKVMFQ